MLDALGVDMLGLSMSGAFIKVDQRCATSMRGIYAIGDVIGGPAPFTKTDRSRFLQALDEVLVWLARVTNG